MSDRIPLPGNIPPAKLLLRTAGACDLNPPHLLEAFGEQRRRFIAVLQGFGPDDWAAPTRCADWSAHDVVSHLCDGNAIAASAGPDDPTLDMAAGFDPRITPRRWLTASAGEPPDATLTRFVATSEKVLALLRTRLAQNRRFDIRLPYGPMDWTVFVLHGFWDSWLHERDVLLARGTDHPTDADATAYATGYGLFIAAAVASMFGDQVQEKLTLGGDGGGVFDLDTRGAVTLTVTRITTARPPAAQVTDALAGRTQTAAVLGDLPARSRAALSHLADFFNTPAEQGQTLRPRHQIITDPAANPPPAMPPHDASSGVANRCPPKPIAACPQSAGRTWQATRRPALRRSSAAPAADSDQPAHRRRRLLDRRGLHPPRCFRRRCMDTEPRTCKNRTNHPCRRHFSAAGAVITSPIPARGRFHRCPRSPSAQTPSLFPLVGPIHPRGYARRDLRAVLGARRSRSGT